MAFCAVAAARREVNGVNVWGLALGLPARVVTPYRRRLRGPDLQLMARTGRGGAAHNRPWRATDRLQGAEHSMTVGGDRLSDLEGGRQCLGGARDSGCRCSSVLTPTASRRWA